MFVISFKGPHLTLQTLERIQLGIQARIGDLLYNFRANLNYALYLQNQDFFTDIRFSSQPLPSFTITEMPSTDIIEGRLIHSPANFRQHSMVYLEQLGKRIRDLKEILRNPDAHRTVLRNKITEITDRLHFLVFDPRSEEQIRLTRLRALYKYDLRNFPARIKS
jgi:hypothetical protein